MGGSKGSATKKQQRKPSVVEQLHQLRAFVGDEFCERDLSLCLSKSGYSVELAAERLITGQYQPSKKARSSASSALRSPSASPLPSKPPTPSSSFASAVGTAARPSPPPSASRPISRAISRVPSRPLHTPQSRNTVGHSRHSATASASKRRAQVRAHARTTPSATTVRTPARPAPTTPTRKPVKRKLPPSSSASKSSTKRTNIPERSLRDTFSNATGNSSTGAYSDANKLQNAWLLCNRWVSDGVCTTKGGAIDYKEQLQLDVSHTGSKSMVRFRGRRIQGQFPKHLSRILSPIARIKPVSPIHVQLEALMEERGLPIGAQIPFSVRIWIVDPNAFFRTFDTVEVATKSSSSMFLRRKAAQASSKGEPTVQEAAFELLQWGQHGDDIVKQLQVQSQIRATSNTSAASTNVHGHSDNAADAETEADAEAQMEEEAKRDATGEAAPQWAKTIIESNDEQRKAQLPEMDGPSGLSVELRFYQKQALHWMMQREQEHDLETMKEQLSLLSELAATNTDERARQTSQPAEFPSHVRSGVYCDCGPVIVQETTAQTARSIDGGDAKRAQLNHPLWERRYLASSDMSAARCFYVQTMSGKASAAPPQAPAPCRGGILADSMGLGKTVMLLALIVKSKEVESENAQGPTLVITPLSLLSQWENEIRSKTMLSHKVNYSDKKVLDFDDNDVVLTTYGSLQAEMQKYLKLQETDESLKPSGILAHRWKRIILDEAHYIKNHATLISKSCTMLQAERRWCVSGTIIQNSLNDVYSLLRFLRHHPWCQNSFWKSSVGDIVHSDMDAALNRVQRLLKPIMLRRTKNSVGKDGTPILSLPPVETKVISVEFSDAERQFYDALHKKSLNLFKGFITAGTASKSWLAIFSLLHRLRLTCDHVALTVKSHLDENDWNSHVGGSDGVKAESGAAGEAKTEGGAGQDGSGDSRTIDDQFLDNLLASFKTMTGEGDALVPPHVGSQPGEMDDHMDGAVGNNRYSNNSQSSAKFSTKSSAHSQLSQQTAYSQSVLDKFKVAVDAHSTQLEEECSICLEPINFEDGVVTPCLHMFCKKCLQDVLLQNASQSLRPDVIHSTSSQQSITSCPDAPCPVCCKDIQSSKILILADVHGKNRTNSNSHRSARVKQEVSAGDSNDAGSDDHGHGGGNRVAAVKEGKYDEHSDEHGDDRDDHGDGDYPDLQQSVSYDGSARQVLNRAVRGTSSTKLDAIINELHNVWEENPGSKVLIFSQFLGFLDLLQRALRKNGISHGRLDGRLSLKERVAVLDEFGSSAPPPPPTNPGKAPKIGSVLLISMKAGGVGLNLVAAQSVFIADPWWHASMEDQCIDRIHRIGQTASKIRVRKFYVKNSVEERIVELQRRKKAMASNILCDKTKGGDPNQPQSQQQQGGNTRPSLDDFKILFQE